MSDEKLFDITIFDEYREDNRREIKRASEYLPSSLWDTYSSFANCYGGVIILGVTEGSDGSWHATGIRKPEKLIKDFWDIIHNTNKVSINILTENNIEKYKDSKSGNTILVINVPPASREQKPVYINNDLFGGTFRRDFEGDYHCTPSEVKAMLRDQAEETSDMKILDNMDISVLNAETVEFYRNRQSAFKPGHPWVKVPYEDYLLLIGAAGYSEKDNKLHPTAAGLLMFGEEYMIVREFPEYFLDYREMLDPVIRWTDRLQSSSGEWTGNVFDFYFRVYNKLAKVLKVPFRMEGGNRIDDTPMHKALREALANCLVNTDYFLPRAVVIKMDAERIVMENPGSIRTGKKQMLRGGISDPRNRTLMKMFNMINIGERAGSGVPDIFSVWESEGLQAPDIQEEYGPDRTILTLPLTKQFASDIEKETVKIHEEEKKMFDTMLQVSKTEAIILNLLASEPNCSYKDIEDKLSIGRTTVSVCMKNLKDRGIIERIGSNKHGYWKLNL